MSDVFWNVNIQPWWIFPHNYHSETFGNLDISSKRRFDYKADIVGFVLGGDFGLSEEFGIVARVDWL